jgi:hypothetical protein
VTINKQQFFLWAAFCLLCSCADKESVRLTIDFSTRSEWRYALCATVKGSIVSADTQRTFESAAQCTLRGKPDTLIPSILHAVVSSVTISSDILGEAEIRNLVEQAKGVRLTCAITDGMVTPEDSSTLPIVLLGEWNLYKDLAKTIPALPKIKIRPKSSWDREKAFPLETKQGSAVGNLYQTFSLDSLYRGEGDCTFALIRWKFTYLVTLKDPDTTGLLFNIPLKGTGTGSAVVNVTGKTLERASVRFFVPASNNGTFKLSWKEEIELTLIK